MAFEGLSSKLQEFTRKLKGKARITAGRRKGFLRRGLHSRSWQQA